MLPYFMKIYLFFYFETDYHQKQVPLLVIFMTFTFTTWPWLRSDLKLLLLLSHILIAYTVIKCSCFGISSPNDNKLAQKKYIFKGF